MTAAGRLVAGPGTALLALLIACGGDGGSGPPNLTLVRMILAPDTTTLVAGGHRQFFAVGKMSDSSVQVVSVTYSATGGTITAAGFYSAPGAAGSYRIHASAQSQPTLQDSSDVTVLAAPPPGSYTATVGEDWTVYANDAALMSQGIFGWGSSGSAGPIDNYVDLVADATFGQVVRITQPQSSGSYSPQMSVGLPGTLDKTWLRFRMRYSVGWTSVGASGPSLSNAYKVMHLYMPGGGSTGRTKLEIENTNHLDAGFGFPNRSYTETLMPGNTWGPGGSEQMTTEMSDGEWYEYIVYHEKTGTTTGQARFWRRRLTTSGAIVNNAFAFVGWTYVGSAATDTFPQINAMKLGINKNRSNDATQYIYWGPWELVDGSTYPNPWGVGP